MPLHLKVSRTFYITFEDSEDKSTHRAKAKWQACKYFKNEIMHP